MPIDYQRVTKRALSQFEMVAARFYLYRPKKEIENEPSRDAWQMESSKLFCTKNMYHRLKQIECELAAVNEVVANTAAASELNMLLPELRNCLLVGKLGYSLVYELGTISLESTLWLGHCRSRTSTTRVKVRQMNTSLV
ncbi:hypothetical protein EVAR_55045_1 [Eumeta japonica]|uniref:Uncharacterized protein n=1 Tax=Eumeta variegata TaxID=151549 RepID=A0A4C1ZNA3_EUMVA|nr:hypothetical protein EVAR_55045_1 [Eumeta japonica]